MSFSLNCAVKAVETRRLIMNESECMERIICAMFCYPVGKENSLFLIGTSLESYTDVLEV